jgi:ribosomal protein S18 acetylase RimI-like enzyme|tara:strand:- start:5939 stop:6547 length:609 start_codon:yes stop_codon:yes gene_type:complete
MALTVRQITSQDIVNLSHCFKRAFDQDPVMRWIFFTEREWERCALRYFSMAIREYIRSGHALTTDGLEGAALWLKPDSPKPGFWYQVVAYMKMSWLFRGGFVRGLQIEEALQHIHPKQPHWYLSVIGTDTRHRGKGVGPALLQSVLQQCDEQNLPAYLESSNQKNISFYIRHGFEILRDVSIPDGPTLWPMLRQPQHPEGSS